MPIEECKAMADEFSFRSKAGFENCVGCINGMLLWTEKPFHNECERVGVDSGKFYCGRECKFGLNLQGVCDACQCFTYISVKHPALASEYLSFIMSSLYQQLTQGSGLPNNYCLYGDNAYVNESYPNTSSGPRDAYNYYQSQVLINIECTFGVLMNRWHLLESPLSARIRINRINALMSCLCRIHNFCIDHGNAKPLQHYEHDLLTLMDFINHYDDDNPHSVRPLGGGEHFIDMPEGRQGTNRRSQRLTLQHLANNNNDNNNNNKSIPCNTMLQHVITKDIHQPRPFNS